MIKIIKTESPINTFDVFENHIEHFNSSEEYIIYHIRWINLKCYGFVIVKNLNIKT
jgi:hypothetical protein